MASKYYCQTRRKEIKATIPRKTPFRYPDLIEKYNTVTKAEYIPELYENYAEMRCMYLKFLSTCDNTSKKTRILRYKKLMDILQQLEWKILEHKLSI